MIYPILAQRDPRWANVMLGFNPPGSEYTIGNYGCLLVSMAMLIGTEDVLALHECRKAHGDFKPWSGVASTFDVADCAAHVRLIDTLDLPGGIPPATLGRIRMHLWRQPAIFEVDYNLVQPGLQQHFVLATGIDAAGRVVIHDPWDGIEEPLTPRYGANDSRAIWRALLYEVGG